MKKSIVFRGIPANTFSEALTSCRQWFNGEIVLSTWEGEYIDDSWPIDKLVLSKDPGPTLGFSNPSLKFSTRQLTSALKGVEESTGDVVLLTRTDMSHSSDIFSFYENNKILCGNMMTIDPDSHLQEKYFRICDWFQLSNRTLISNFVDVMDMHFLYLNSGCCMEQIWNISFLNEVFGYRINPYDLTPFRDRYWNILTKHYNIMNTISTLNSVNLNWADQPEDLSCYLTEEKIHAR
jgi:hypothetical protein